MEGNPNTQSLSLHGEATTIQPNPRPITIEDNVLHQIDRIGYLRSVGEDWKEPVFHLRDILVGLEDDEFWNGVPMHLQKSKDMIPAKQLEEYKKRSWTDVECDMKVMKDSNGREMAFLSPTPIQLSKMLQILMALLARRGMTWRKRNVDEISMSYGGESANV